MKKIVACALVASIAGAVGSAHAQTNVGISIGINQPGVYGRINIGNLPPPPLVYAQPVLIAPPPVVVQRAPIYLYVPPTHQQNWARYCSRYSACGQPVYFVEERWVRERYEHEHPGWNNGRHRGWDKHEDKHESKHEGKHGGKYKDHDDEGRGEGHGRGHKGGRGD